MPSVNATLAAPDTSSQNTRGRFFLHLALWSAVYCTVVVAWGVRNSWPNELGGALFFFPLNLFLSWKLYRSNQWSFETRGQPLEWELFVTYLLLAIGVASGLLLLMAVGWICMGFAWLRPTRDTVAWSEWFKLPLVFLFCFPILLDLAGSRHDWFRFFGAGSSDLIGGLPEHLILTRLHFLAGLTVWLLAYLLTGALFWISLPIVPLLLFANWYLSKGLPSAWLGSATAAETFRWLFLPVATVAYTSVIRPFFRQGLGSPRILNTSAQWVLSRSFTPWLASLVILLQQSSLIESWLAGGQARLDLPSVMCLIAVLVWLRWRGTTDEIHSGTRIFVAAALFVLLAAEWTDFDPLRHFSFGLLLVGLLSWRRSWPWYIMFTALFAWLVTVPATFTMLLDKGLSPTTALAWRLAAFFSAMVALIIATVRFRPQPAFGTYDNYGWQPIKRFAFTLLILLLAFQTASSFWPVSNAQIPSEIYSAGGDNRLVSLPEGMHIEGMTDVRRWRTTKKGEDGNVLIAVPVNVPFRLDAPELILKAWGWRIVQRRLCQHPSGEAVELQMERGSQRGSALFWFQNGDHAFTNFLRGRRILWSGWNLTRRDLRLIIVHSENLEEPDKLKRLADSQDWFRPSPKRAE